jgi:hypothetical protein
MAREKKLRTLKELKQEYAVTDERMNTFVARASMTGLHHQRSLGKM